jgi:hypothetical protein
LLQDVVECLQFFDGVGFGEGYISLLGVTGWSSIQLVLSCNKSGINPLWA